jgi:hypothetical protein
LRFIVAVDGVIVTVGLLFTVTDVFAVFVQPLAAVTVTVYVPVDERVELEITGFCETELKALGPVHTYPDIPDVEVRFIADPRQTGLLLPAVTVGLGFTVAVTTLLLNDKPPNEATLR